MEPIAIIPYNYYEMAGSTFLRAKGLVEKSDRFEIWKHGKKYENIIAQKVLWKEMFSIFPGNKILDICDPDWFGGQRSFMAVANLADAITCSSPALTEYIKSLFPEKIVAHIADRLNFNALPNPREFHVGPAKKVAWFGYIHNAQETLTIDFFTSLKELDLTLTFISDKPFELPPNFPQVKINFIKFRYESAYNQLKDYDIIINARSNHPLYRFKSNNKSITAWYLGIPVAETVEDIFRYKDADTRNSDVLEKKKWVKMEYDIERSAYEYIEIFEKINQQKLK